MIPVAHGVGSPRAMGLAQGEALAKEIHAAASFYNELANRKAGLAPAYAELGPFVDAARAHVPDLADEVDGLADGAGIDADMAWFMNAMEEVWPFEACTTIISSRWLLHAEQWYAGHKGVGVVIAEPQGAPPFVSPTCAGFLPCVGMNAAGIAQGVNSLSMNDERTGIPRLLVARSVLSAHDLKDAKRIATMPHRAGGYSHVLATVSQTITVETTATAHEVLIGERAHTNHVLGSELDSISPKRSDGSVARLTRAQQLLEESPPRSLEDCVALLSDHVGEPQTICFHDGSGALVSSATNFGVVCDLASGVVAVSAGRPCSSEWEEFAVPGFERSEAGRVG